MLGERITIGMAKAAARSARGLLKTGAECFGEKTRGDMHNHNAGVLAVGQGRGEE